MGVVNITPNSFSDGGKNFEPRHILKTLEYFNKHNIEIFDFGAESTAPFNDPVSKQDELSRYEENLFPILEDVLKFNKAISIDTYKPEIFGHVAEKILKIDSKANIIWNDVSGIVDKETNTSLKEFPNTSYVLSHNLAPSREKTSDHMKYVKNDLSNDDIVNFFKERLGLLEHKNIILDPCFGFSKSFDQNWNLINKLPEVVKCFDMPWLLGVSRKSFLKVVIKEIDPDLGHSYTENLHILVLSKWSQELPQGSYFIRVHDAALGHTLASGQQILT